MRQRDRTRVQMWLKKLAGDEADGRVASTQRVIRSLDVSWWELIYRHHRLITVWQQGYCYHVQIIPRRYCDDTLSAPVGVAYEGNNIQAILSAAVQDAERLAEPNPVWEGSAREVVRWVA